MWFEFISGKLVESGCRCLKTIGQRLYFKNIMESMRLDDRSGRDFCTLVLSVSTGCRRFLLLCVFIWGVFLVACSQRGTDAPPFPRASSGDLRAGNLVGSTTFTPGEEISFKNITVEDGLSQSTVGCIFQDSLGFVWFCTYEGVDRFDGYRFVNFNHDPEDANTIRDNVVYAIAEDQDGWLWFGTQSGLDRYDPQTGTVDHISLNPTVTGTSEAVIVSSLLVDGDGDLWVGTLQGLFRLDIETNQIGGTVYYDLLEVEGKRVTNNPVGTILEDAQGVIWAGSKQGLARYDQESDSFIFMLVKPLAIGNLVTQAIIEIEPGILLMGGGYGLILYDIEADRSDYLRIDDIHSPTSVLRFSLVWSLVKGDFGTVWVGTDSGLIRLDPGSKKGVFLPQIQEDANHPDPVIAILKDREENVWIGTLNQGIFVQQAWQNKFKPPEAYISTVIQRGNVETLYVDRQGFLWIGGEQELFKFDRINQEVMRYPYQSFRNHGQIHNPVRDLIEDADGRLWVGTADGSIYFYDRESKDFTPMFVRSFRWGDEINLFYLDSDGDVWVGTSAGLYWYQHARDRIEPVASDSEDQNALSNLHVLAIQEDSAGSLWVGTWDGLWVFDKDSNEFFKYDLGIANPVVTIDESILAIIPDPSGGLWLGSQSGGLHYLDVTTGKLTRYQDVEGFTAGMIFAILRDDQEKLWLSTQRGLSKFDPQLGTFTHYTHEDGLPSDEFVLGAHFQSEAGEIFLGGIDGFISFYPDEILRNPYIPAIVLTDVTQNGVRIESETPIDHLEALTLSWPQNYFEFKFAALSHTKPENNQYAYYMEEIDPDWVFSGKNRSGRYVNLPGGSHILHLVGSNNDGVWNTEGRKIIITIIPPVWQRPWFQAAVAAGILAVAFGSYLYRVRRVLSRSNELEQLVAARTADLSRMNQQLVAEINEREKAEQQLAQRIAAEAVLNERNRLAKDLHDAVTQTIFSASIISETLPRLLESDPDKFHQQIDELQHLTRGALAELRSLLVELRPEWLVKANLKDLLAQLGRGIIGRSGIPVEVNCDTQVDIPSEVKIALYRIAQEALNNASRHADPAHITVHCSSDHQVVRLTIQDDGKGFDQPSKPKGRLGLEIMKERAADVGAILTIKTQVSCGTTINVEWFFPKNGVYDE